jgi:O-succinylbenzoate synthase
VIIKAAPLGGVAAALRIAARLDLPTVVSGALDTSVGLSAGLALAAALPGQPYAAGLGTGRLLAHDVLAGPVVPHDGRLDVIRHEPDSAALAAAAERVPIDRREWWTDRLARCLGALTATAPNAAHKNTIGQKPAGWSV